MTIPARGRKFLSLISISPSDVDVLEGWQFLLEGSETGG